MEVTVSVMVVVTTVVESPLPRVYVSVRVPFAGLSAGLPSGLPSGLPCSWFFSGLGSGLPAGLVVLGASTHFVQTVIVLVMVEVEVV